MGRKGYLTITISAHCGLCGETDDTEKDNRRQAMSVIRGKGWYLSGRFGWICPECRTRNTWRSLEGRDDDD